MFHLFKIISLLPLAACLPPFSREEASHIGDGMLATEQRWVDLAQFDWDDYVLTGVSLDCQRQAPQDLYSCEYKCKATTSRVVSRSDDFELTNTVHWEDPNFDNSINCNATFDWDGITQEHGENNTYPTGYQICGYWWQFQFDQLRSLWDFNMTITKDQKDPIKFGHQIASFYAYPNITLEKMGQTDFRRLIYSTTGPVNAKIQGMAI